MWIDTAQRNQPRCETPSATEAPRPLVPLSGGSDHPLSTPGWEDDPTRPLSSCTVRDGIVREQASQDHLSCHPSRQTPASFLNSPCQVSAPHGSSRLPSDPLDYKDSAWHDLILSPAPQELLLACQRKQTQESDAATSIDLLKDAEQKCSKRRLWTAGMNPESKRMRVKAALSPRHLMTSELGKCRLKQRADLGLGSPKDIVKLDLIRHPADTILYSSADQDHWSPIV